jgi:tripartite-type tricarboxylate transporter receptor subunit TctC
MMKRSLLTLLIVIAAMSLLGCANKKEEKYPSKPIEMVVSFAAGGSTDQIARVLERGVKKYLPNGQSVVVVNKPGGASVVGTTEVAKAKPDGYKISMVPPGPISIQPLLGNAPYNPDDFQGVIRVATSPILFAVRTDAPWKTFQEWEEYVKQNPDNFIYGSGGIGNPPHTALERFIRHRNLRVKYVPHAGTSAAYTALLGGHIDGYAASTQEIKGQLEAKEIRILANFGTTKADFYKDIPTLKDMGYDMTTDTYFGIVVPKAVPKPIVTILHDAFKKAIEDPEVIGLFEKAGIKADYAGPDEFQKQIVDDYHQYEKVFRVLGLTKK